MQVNEDGRVLAVRYGYLATRRSHEFHRYGVYEEPDEHLDMDYYFWVVRTGDSYVLVDIGYDPAAAATRPGRECLVPPVEALRELGITPDQVSHIVVTHFHFDHIGNLSSFPDAELVVQRRELEFWTGPYRDRLAAAASTEAREIDYVARMHRAGRVTLVDGDHEVVPGVTARLALGHCPGQQIVEVDGPTPLMLCSDALHYYEEMEEDRPYNVFFDLEQMFHTYARLRDWQGKGGIVVPGHDPAVRERFPGLPGAEDLATVLR